MSGNEKIEILAKRLRDANVLGRSEPLKKLFEFLVARAADATAPKELEIADVIFDPAANFDATQDASVRVYMHRLRQKLDGYYKGPGRGESERLSIPKGSGYRLIAVPQPEHAPAGGGPKQWLLPAGWAVAAALALLLALNAVGLGFNRAPPDSDDILAVRNHAPWAGLLADARPITLVVGDYYIFGDLGGDGGSDRLVREYAINSPADLDEYLMRNPALADRYMDLDLYYLPVSTAFALRSILPVLSRTAKDRERLHIVQMSDLTPDMIKRTNIVYVGYLSGLGLLREPVFLGSRFSVGTTYDELIDNVGNRHYLSQEGGPDESHGKLKDYGYFSTFAGPNGNRIVIIAGTRDIAVMQTAETVSKSDSLDALMEKAGGVQSFEALYEVEGLRRINLGGRLLLTSPLKTDRIWNGQPSDLRFPDG